MPAFWFHYNKPESLKRRRNVLTVHYQGKCHMVEAIDCQVPIKTKDRKSQPRCVMSGKGVMVVEDNKALIVPESTLALIHPSCVSK
jgi:hypothetical protein